MKAAVYHGANDLRVQDVPVPTVGPGEILLRVDACGVCGTDVKKVQKGLLTGPRVFGHETAGTVVTTGSGVARFREGDRVVVLHHIPCGTCFYCQRKAYAQCAFYKKNGTTAGFEPAGGGLAEYVKAFDWIVERGTIPIPDGVLAEEATFVEPVNTCLKAVRKTGVGRGQTVLVVGQGQIGLILTQLARWSGGRVVASDLMADRREISHRLGAEVVLDGTNDIAAEVRGLTDGRGADVTLLAAVGPRAFTQAVEATRPAGRVMVFSATSRGETAEVDLGQLTVAEKDILTSYSSSVEIQELSARLVFDRQINVRDLVTHRFPLRETARAMELTAHPGPGVLKVVVEPQSEARST